jgi:hypothetical protein
VLRLDVGHHTLTCAACGAPLSKLKSMPISATMPQPAVTHQPAVLKMRKFPKSHDVRRSKPSKRTKRRKSLLRKFAEEAFDLVEDIFD